jgi:protein ImuA
VAELREQLHRFEAARQPADRLFLFTGFEPLDRLLPWGRLSRGTLIEWLAPGEGSGAAWLALAAARAACREDGPLLVIDGQRTFYPPAAVAAGFDPDRLFVVRTAQARDEGWALDQALRSSGVGAVFCISSRLSPHTMRRLRLAAESSGGLGLLVRPAAVRDEPCWAEARLLVQPLTGRNGRRLQITLLRARGTNSGGSVELEIDDETGTLHLATELAPAAGGHRRRT